MDKSPARLAQGSGQTHPPFPAGARGVPVPDRNPGPRSSGMARSSPPGPPGVISNAMLLGPTQPLDPHT
eukprot:CAMPEP_0118948830 /NCGR_PEP_ID=MMETSP1169-20130426/48533_1 /TAXON_ID=36882 /ORGANISM="Pyramimonas obovata, Strain CCMP722" /LENGTH=68 /DNA_ID=CAMNT_0006895345 /DNA_START=1 /DNA_END=204 /DNA_ORIENTATION=+